MAESGDAALTKPVTTHERTGAPDHETIAALQLRSVPAGLFALDALVKEAQVRIRFAGDVDPSRYLIVMDGDLANVEVGLARAAEAAGSDVLETLLLANAHHLLRAGLAGTLAPVAVPSAQEATIGVLQCHTVLGTIAAVDRALKAADVELVRLRIATHLAGHGHAVVCGEQFDVQEALLAAENTMQNGVVVDTRLIPRAALETFLAAAQRAPGPRPLAPLDP